MHGKGAVMCIYRSYINAHHTYILYLTMYSGFCVYTLIFDPGKGIRVYECHTIRPSSTASQNVRSKKGRLQCSRKKMSPLRRVYLQYISVDSAGTQSGGLRPTSRSPTNFPYELCVRRHIRNMFLYVTNKLYF